MAKLRRISSRLPFVTQLGAITKGVGSNNLGNDICNKIVVDRFENTICAGWSAGAFGGEFFGVQDFIVAKFDVNGKLLWTYQNGTAAIDRAHDLAVDRTGAIYVVGCWDSGTCDLTSTTGDAFIEKISPDGKRIWHKNYHPGGYSIFTGISIRKDQEIFVTGGTQGNFSTRTKAGALDPFILKLNLDGEITQEFQLSQEDAVAWDGSGPRIAEEDDVCTSLTFSLSGEYVYCGGVTKSSLTEPNGGSGSYDIFFLRLRTSDLGELLMTQFGDWTDQNGSPAASSGTSTLSEGLQSLRTLSNGDIVAVGNTLSNLGDSNPGGQDAIILTLGKNLEKLSITQFGTPTDEIFHDVVPTSDGSFIACGYSRGNYFETSSGVNVPNGILFIGKTGQRRQLGLTSGKVSLYSTLRSITLDTDGNAYLAGATTGSLGEQNGGLNDLFIMRLNGELNWVKLP